MVVWALARRNARSKEAAANNTLDEIQKDRRDAVFLCMSLFLQMSAIGTKQT
jgi:hypothetical protein